MRGAAARSMFLLLGRAAAPHAPAAEAQGVMWPRRSPRHPPCLPHSGFEGRGGVPPPSPTPIRIVRLAPPPLGCRGIGGASQGSPCRSVPQLRGRVAAGSWQSATRCGRARPSGWALRQRGSASPTAQPVAERFSQGASRSPGGHVAGPRPARATTLPPTASFLRAGACSPHNTHLLLPGPSRAGARATPVSRLTARAVPAAEVQRRYVASPVPPPTSVRFAFAVSMMGVPPSSPTPTRSSGSRLRHWAAAASPGLPRGPRAAPEPT